MPRRAFFVLPLSLALLCLGAALAWPRVAPPVEAQGSSPFTLLAVEYWRGFLYAVDPASGALGPLARVPAPPESVGFIALVPNTRRILMTSQPHSPSDPSRLWQVDLDSPNRPLTAVLTD